jgi:hypothetical protein
MTRGRAWLGRLGRERNRYATGAAAAKLEALAALAPVRLRRPRDLVEFHGHLLFLRAFPDDERVRLAAVAALEAFARRVRGLPARALATLEDSGLAGSTSRHAFEAPVARWLADRFGASVELDWRAMPDSSGIDFLLGLVTGRAEQDGLESERLTTRQWLRRAKGAERISDLAWLLRELRRRRATRPLWQALYDDAGVPLAWRLRDGAGAAARNVLPVAAVHYRGRGLRRLPADPRRLIAAPLAGITLLDAKRAEAVIDVTRAALTARCREVYAISYANPQEVYLADLGAGTTLALLGVLPARRLSLESNYGYLLLSNGVPVGYAGVTPLYRQANTGINIFEPFRGSEAGFLCAQTLRAFHTLFGVERFVLNPYQIGAGNSEAIASGAFWFYYRLGFRPVAAELAALAAAEHRRQLGSSGRRTDARTLRRLAQSDVELVLPGARRRDRFAETWLAELSLLASERLARDAGGDGRERGAERLATRVARSLGVRRLASWPEAERAAFVALAPLVALLELGSLDASSRAGLVRLMRAKGAAQEAPYVRAAAADRHLLPGLMAAARRAGSARARAQAT